MCSNALTPWWTYPTWASRPAVSTRSVIAPRHACQITPPVGSAVSIATRGRVDQPRGAEVPGPGRAAGLLVADAVEDDPAIAEQAELAGGDGAVEHRDQAALHVRGPAAADPSVAALRLELRPALRRDDVEVPVEVDELRAVADAPAHDRGVLQRAGRRELDQLGRDPEPLHRVAQHLRAAAERAAGRVLGRDPDERLEQLRHRVRPRVEPRLHLALRHAREATGAGPAG